MCLGCFNTNMMLKKIFRISCKSSIRCLGTYAGSNYAKNYQINWSVKLEKIKSCLERWECRDLTLFGNVQVIKILALPQIILSATLLHEPENVISELNKMFYKFLWGKVERLKRLKVIKKDSEGGLGIVDLDSLFNSFKAVWISCIMKADPENDNWIQIPILLFSKLGGIRCDKRVYI